MKGRKGATTRGLAAICGFSDFHNARKLLAQLKQSGFITGDIALYLTVWSMTKKGTRLMDDLTKGNGNGD